MNKFQLVIIASLALAACSPKVETGGYIRDGDVKASITPGVTTRDEVSAMLGSPSARSSFGAETWYYVTNRKETYGFLKPEVVEQDVLRIEFDSGGVVSSAKGYTREDGQDIEMARRVTPTEGHELGFFEQIMGNIGRFNKSGNTSAAPGRQQRR